MNRIFTELLARQEKNEDTVLAVIVGATGSVPRGAGAMMLVGAEGRLVGTIGGGAAEHRAELCAAELLRGGGACRRVFSLRDGGEDGLGAVCGGELELLLCPVRHGDEAFRRFAEAALARIAAREPGWIVLSETEPPVLSDAPAEGALPLPVGERAVIFGAGHCAAALAPLLRTVGFRVTVFDDRAELLTPSRFPDAERVTAGDFCRIGAALTLGADDYAVVMTSGHRHDFEVEEQLLRLETAYVGVIGSRSKTAAVNALLREAGISEAAIARVHTPIGLPIKAVTPEEIAVSVAAEMILVRAERREKAGILPARQCPMHND